jgi:hypothetical protein
MVVLVACSRTSPPYQITSVPLPQACSGASPGRDTLFRSEYGARHFIDQPVFGNIGGRRIAISDFVTSWPVSERKEAKLAGLVIDSGRVVDSISLPAKMKNWRMPRILAEDSDGLSVVWGTTSDSTSAGIARAESLWVGDFDGLVWKEPYPILVARHIAWHEASPAVSGYHKNLYVSAISEGLDGVAHRLWFVRRIEGVWRAQSIMSANNFLGLLEVRMAVTRSGRIVLAVSGFEYPDVQSRLPVVHLLHSDDSGAIWSAPRTVVRAPKGTSILLTELAVGSDNKLELLWRYQRDGQAYADSVFRSVSSDSGAVWSTIASVGVPEKVEGMIARYVNGVPVVVLMTLAAELRIGIFSSSTSGRDFRTIGENKRRVSPIVAVTNDSMIHVWWGEYGRIEAQGGNVWGAGFSTVKSTIALRCLEHSDGGRNQGFSK